MARLTTRLRSLVRETQDPWVVVYVIENLGQGIVTTTSYASHIQRLKQEYMQILLQMYWATPQRKLAPHEKQRTTMQRFLFEQWAKEQSKNAQAMDTLFREFNQDDTADIVTRLKDEEPINRWMAIQVAQRRWEPLESFLIELLEDPAPQVRQAAHQALVRLSRGNDFGPAGPNPHREQIRVAQKQWRGWLELQDR